MIGIQLEGALGVAVAQGARACIPRLVTVCANGQPGQRPRRPLAHAERLHARAQPVNFVGQVDDQRGDVFIGVEIALQT